MDPALSIPDAAGYRRLPVGSITSGRFWTLRPHRELPCSEVKLTRFSRTPEHLRSSPPCRTRDEVIRLSFAGKWSSWCKPDARRRKLAGEFEPTARSIRNWIAQAKRDGGSGDGGLTTAERGELSRLRLENRQLRLEREILSKAAAWFARETNAIPAKGSGSRAITRVTIRSPPCAGCWVSPPAATTHGRNVGRRGGLTATAR